jgi:hypothetical protein
MQSHLLLLVYCNYHLLSFMYCKYHLLSFMHCIYHLHSSMHCIYHLLSFMHCIYHLLSFMYCKYHLLSFICCKYNFLWFNLIFTYKITIHVTIPFMFVFNEDKQDTPFISIFYYSILVTSFTFYTAGILLMQRDEIER